MRQGWGAALRQALAALFCLLVVLAAAYAAKRIQVLQRVDVETIGSACVDKVSSFGAACADKVPTLGAFSSAKVSALGAVYTAKLFSFCSSIGALSISTAATLVEIRNTWKPRISAGESVRVARQHTTSIKRLTFY